MPESPEVEALVEELDATITGCRLSGVEVIEFRAWKTRERPPASIAGATVTGVRRFGKHVALGTDRGAIVVSLGRAGWMRLTAPGARPHDDDPPAIVRFALEDGRTLEATDSGEWLSIAIHVSGSAADVPAIAGLGPDPLAEGWSRADFDRAIGARRKQLKALLQEQASIAGIGNAYSDEILHVARLSPTAHAADLGPSQRDDLFAAIGEVLAGAARARRGVPMSLLKAEKVAAMRVHGRAGETCPVCGGSILDLPGSRAGAQYCPVCQTGGVPLSG